MPWKAQDIMSTREEFVVLASRPDANRRELCRRFGISPQTGYKWLERYLSAGREALVDRSRRPVCSPARTDEALERCVVELRGEHPAWGGRKISRRLMDLGKAALAPSTVNSILGRNGLISAAARVQSASWTRFERDAPNALWQTDFKGYFNLAHKRCSPLTLLDDHSRFNLALEACSDITTATVKERMRRVFARYGLPLQMNFDNGAPWGSPKQPGQITELGVWLVRLGIRVTHSRPYHPQTNGKDERFHRTLKAEVLAGGGFDSFEALQGKLDRWRDVYNQQRPHEALQMATPISRYQPSPRCLPDVLPEIEYGPDDEVQRVGWAGVMRFRGRKYKLSNALMHYDVALRPHPQTEGVYEVFFAHHRCLRIDLRNPTNPQAQS